MDEKSNSNHNFVCNICGSRKNLKRCGFCKCTFYCSREHQLNDWVNHKQKCQLLGKGLSKDVTTENTPSTLSDMKTNMKVEEDVNSSNDNSTTEVKSSEIDSKSSGDTLRGLTTGLDLSSNGKATAESESNGIPFDTRPYQERFFNKMQCEADAVDIAKLAVDKMNEQGFCVLDGLFSNSQIKKALTDISKCCTDGLLNSGKLEGGITSGDEDKQVVNSEIRSDKIMWVEGTEDNLPGVTNIVSKMDAILWEFNQFFENKYFVNGRTKAMIACYPGNGAHYRRHVDNPHGDGRLVTCILYLNKGWNVQEDGGLLRILPAGTDQHIDIAPIANRLLLFWSDKRNPHEVQPAFKTRYAITVWYMDEKERRLAKQKSQTGEMEKVQGEYVLKERQHRLEERDVVYKKIEDAASLAVASLSLDELKAMSSMVAGKPNADSILAEMGIEANIRTKLLQRLKQLDT